MHHRHITRACALAVAGCIAAACAQPPIEPAVAPVRDTTVRIAETDVVPPFRARPLVASWGPLPPGTPHAERARSYDLQHQIVRVRFDWPHHTVIGSTILRIVPLDSAITTIALDAVGMKIGAVRIEKGAKLKYAYDDSTLTIKLPRALKPKQHVSLEVEYETVAPKKGAYFIDRKHVIWTQGEAEDTRYWVPTFDYPSDKTTWELYVDAPNDERVLSNGMLESTKHLACVKPRNAGKPVATKTASRATRAKKGTGRAEQAAEQSGAEPDTLGDGKARGASDAECESRWHWVLDKPASTYLMSVVVGKLTVVDDKWRDVPVDYWTYPDSVDAAKRGFAHTPQMIELFSKRIGVDYPWSKYDQVVVPDYIFGGMENVTATTQADDDILRPAWAERERPAQGLVAHELAHQWFGDLLTARDWADIWLNEGFAQFMEQIWTEQGMMADDGAYERLEAQRETMAADRAGRRPLVFGNWTSSPFELFFSGHIYPKGAAVLQMLRHQLGDSTFWSAMHRYTADHEFGSVTTADFEKALESETKQDLSSFFKQWVYGAGFPTFRVRSAYDAATKRLTIHADETQPRDSLTEWIDAAVDVEALTDSGRVRGTVPVHDGSGESVLILRAAPRSIRWNKGQWVLALSDFPRSARMLAWQLAHDDDVTGRIEAAELLADRAGDPVARIALDTAAIKDRFWGVRAEAASSIARFASDTLARNSLLEISADPDPRVRRAAVIALRKYPGTFTVTRLRVMAIADASLFVRGAALAAYAALDPDVAMPEIRNALARDSWLDVARAGALDALAGVDAKTAWSILPKYLSGLSSRAAREAALRSLVAQRKGREAELASLVEPLLGDDDLNLRISAANALGALGQQTSVTALGARRKIELDSRVVGAIDGALATLRK